MAAGLPNPQFWKGRRVLLTGHTGFKGAWAALWLHHMGARVTGLALAPDTQPNLFELAHVDAATQSHVADIRDAKAVQVVIDRAEPEIILHMAAQALVRRSYREPVDTFATNIIGTVKVLDAARYLDSLKACLVVTSDKVYENKGDGAAFVDRDGMAGNLHARIVGGVGQVNRMSKPTHGTHRVPESYKMRIAVPREGCAEPLRQSEDLTHSFFVVALLCPVDCKHHTNGVRRQWRISSFDKPVHCQQSGKRASRVGAAAEAKEKHLIVLIVIF